MPRVFVNGKAVDVAAGSTALAAVRAYDQSAAGAVEQGTQIITDSRGLPTPADGVVEAGSILRRSERR